MFPAPLYYLVIVLVIIDTDHCSSCHTSQIRATSLVALSR
jgi:hypothetical protein